MKGPYLIHDPHEGRYYRAPAPQEAHGDWVYGIADATEFPTRAAAEARARQIGGWRWRTRWQGRIEIYARTALPAPRRQLVIPQFAKRFL